MSCLIVELFGVPRLGATYRNTHRGAQAYCAPPNPLQCVFEQPSKRRPYAERERQFP